MQQRFTLYYIFLNANADTNDLPSTNIPLGLFLDLSIAFDTIKHEIGSLRNSGSY
jgi:hypothetical protein